MKDIEDLHDSSIQKICVDIENQIISMVVSIYNNKTKDYYSIRLTFYEVSNFKTNEIFINVLEELEIYTFNYMDMNGKKEIEFMLLIDSGKQSISIKFECGYFKRELL